MVWSAFDIVGLVFIAVGVFTFNIIREKPMQMCIIDGELRKNTIDF